MERLAIAGSLGAPLRRALRERTLAASSAAVCGEVKLTIAREEGVVALELELGSERVRRTVSSVDDAATWVESWLIPLLPAEEAEPAPTVVARAPDPAPLQVALGGAGATEGEGVHYLGFSLDGRVLLSERFFAGCELQTLWDVGDGRSSVGDAERRMLLAGPRLGLQVPLGPALELSAGGALGVLAGQVRLSTPTGDDQVGQGGLAAGLFVGGRLRVVDGLGVSLELGARWHDGYEVADSPPGVPAPPSLAPFHGFATLGLVAPMSAARRGPPTKRSGIR